ncbi:hypothetical protein HNQ94_002631 [Salirhabdus euzebyi]|uniref:Spore coat protein n=1 Tax=Salirhabdus euzebyi TaxID=394506 RepID=A0A841Q6Z0_9BACI|nr:YppG family protein [Salirhabdus euzebyi]MBB6454180.1 hypothetical protein [Salirhabdus euzebyi]
MYKMGRQNPNMNYFQPMGSQQYNYPQQSFPQMNMQQPNNNAVGSSTPYEQFQKPPMPMGYFPMQQGNNYGANSFGPKNMNGFMKYFQDQNGQMDFDKMFSTVGQMANTFHQVSPIVKQLGTFMKGFKA